MANYSRMSKSELQDEADRVNATWDEDMTKEELIESIEEAVEDSDEDSEQEDADDDTSEAPSVSEPETLNPESEADVDAEYAKVFLKTVDGSRRNFTFKDRFGRDWKVVSGEKTWSASGPETIEATLRKSVVRSIARNIAQYAKTNPETVATPTESSSVDA